MRTYKNFGEAMRRIRRESGITQVELAEIADVHSQFVSNWERGLCAPPPLAFKRIKKKLPINKEVIRSAIGKDWQTDLQSHLDSLLRS
jgi:transcriptional regulator with XRE-family HTH domain